MQLPDSNIALRNLSAIIDFSNNINSNLNLEFALNNLLLTCFGKLKITKGFIALFNDEDELKINLSKGFKSEIFDTFPHVINGKVGIEIFNSYMSANKFGLVKEIVFSDQLLGFLVLGEKLSKEDFSEEDNQFISTVMQIGSAAIRNVQSFEKLSNVNKVLDSKINQLNSIFDLGKEFSSILEIERVSKLLVYSISAQMLVSKYAIVIFNENSNLILESKYEESKLNEIMSSEEINSINSAILLNENNTFCRNCSELGIALIVPMMIKKVKKGLIFLGSRITKNQYSKSDIEYISSIASFAIISIENSRLFDEALEKQKLEKDLEIARSIQQNLLPKKLPKSSVYQIDAVNKTAKMVGGDYFDIVEISKNEILIAIADVSGKGIQASLLMANLQAFLKSIYKQNYKLQEASNFLNDLVSENTTNGSFITFFWGILNLENKQFTYVNMGHNPPLLIRDKKITKLKKGGMILGVMKTVIPYEYETVELKSNDAIILFTDGVTEAMNINNEEYGDERLENLCLQNSENEAKSILKKILADVELHTKGANQSDDITSLILKIN
ncbi:MAG: SpoIIE family protein phosphatase [Ignavibacteriae bacterium]|nr:SpoIIE family protein phosphatase [Ignavibacteriota bacterium]MCB9218506.1 SpoIIE family protein phosphatase [Ignavibacteriales bacterium]MCB9259488.1 SpoIIE family protein phosphatase [Ignavibacteriales bacterium]